MPIETRFMRNDETLGLTNTSVYDMVDVIGNGAGYFQIRVRSESGVIVDWTSNIYMDEVWAEIRRDLNIPKTKVQNLFVDVKVVCGSSSQIITFSLLGLNASVKGNWSFYLWGQSVYDVLKRWHARFRYGDSVYNSRIANFEYVFEIEKVVVVRPTGFLNFVFVYVKRKRRLRLRRVRGFWLTRADARV